MNDNIINSILNSIVISLLEALKPRIDELVDAKIKAMPDPLNGSYVTAEEFREYERRLESIESTLNITQDIDPSDLKSLEERVKELEENSVDQGQLEDKVAREISDYDIEGKVEEAIDDYDMDDKVNDAISNNSDIVDEDRVNDLINEAINNLRISRQ